MARIFMRNVQKSSVSEYFDLYLSSDAARGVKDKTLQTYKNHFRSIVKRMDVCRTAIYPFTDSVTLQNPSRWEGVIAYFFRKPAQFCWQVFSNSIQ